MSNERKPLLRAAAITRPNSFRFIKLAIIICALVTELVYCGYYAYLEKGPSKNRMCDRITMFSLIKLAAMLCLSPALKYRISMVVLILLILLDISYLIVCAWIVDNDYNSTETRFNITVPILLSFLQLFVVKSLCFESQTMLMVVSDVAQVVEESGLPNDRLSVRTVFMLMTPYFWPHGWTNRVRAVSTYALLGISKTANLIAPLYMAKATNALVSLDISTARTFIGIYCALTLIAKLFKELQSFVYLAVKQTAYNEIAVLTYSHLHSLSLEWHLKKKVGDVLRSMDRGVQSANQVVSYLFLYLIPTLVESVIVIFIFAVHFELAMLATVGFFGLMIYSFLTLRITLWRKKFREATNKHDNEYHDRATDTLINFEAVKYFSREKFEVHRYAEAIEKYQTQSMWSQASLTLLNCLQQIVIQLTIFSALAVAVPHIMHHDHNMNVGSFVAISVYLLNLFAPLSFLGSIYNMMIKAYVDIQKLSELLNVDPDIVDLPNATILQQLPENSMSPAIEFHKVCFSYPSQNSTVGLSDLSFKIMPNTTTALVGKTGSYKTTLSLLLFRFYDLHDGKILVNGQNIKYLQQESLRKSIGVVPQDTVLFNNSILFNLKYAKLDATMEEIEEATKQARIFDYIMQLPNRWNTSVGERGLKLSGGEKQRLAIARIFLKNPPIVILDEATSSLDTVTEKEIQTALSALKHNRTMMVIAHRLSTIQSANQIVVLHRGKIVEMGSHSKLIDGNGAYSQLWGAQQSADLGRT